MFSNCKTFQSSEAYIRSVAALTSNRTRTADQGNRGIPAAWRPRVLIAEYRDEVFAPLNSLLDDFGFQVTRAETDSDVDDKVRQISPDLTLMNEDMPHGSGWLVTCKLRLTRYRQPVWLYAVRQPYLSNDWREFTGVDEVIEYGGVLLKLIQRLRKHLTRRASSIGISAEQRLEEALATAGVA